MLPREEHVLYQDARGFSPLGVELFDPKPCSVPAIDTLRVSAATTCKGKEGALFRA